MGDKEAVLDMEEYRSYRHQMNILYTVCGSVSLLSNGLVLMALRTRRKLSRKRPLIFGIAMGNLANAAHALVYGVYRLLLLRANIIDQPFSVWACLASMMPACFMLGFALPASLQCVMAMERLLASTTQRWYRRHWTACRSRRMLGLTGLTVIITCSIAIWFKALLRTSHVTKECSSLDVLGTSTIMWTLWFSIFCSVLSVLFSLGSVVVGKLRLQRLPSLGTPIGMHLVRQTRVSILMLCVTSLDMVFVVVPNSLFVAQFLGVSLQSIFSFYSIGLYTVYCATNIFVYAFFSKSFRLSLRDVFRGLCMPFRQLSQRRLSKVRTFDMSQI